MVCYHVFLCQVVNFRLKIASGKQLDFLIDITVLKNEEWIVRVIFC